jgi:hypothetical protein
MTLAALKGKEMKKIFAILILCINCHANASLIEVVVSDNAIKLGERIEVNLLASNFESFDTFGFDILFDTSIVSFDTSTFTSDLFAELTVFGIFEATPLAGGVAFSFSDFSPLDTSDFLLASFELVGLGAGITSLSLANVEFFEPFPSSTLLPVDGSSTASIAVSEPPAFALLLMAGVCMLRARHRFNNNVNQPQASLDALA